MTARLLADLVLAVGFVGVVVLWIFGIRSEYRQRRANVARDNVRHLAPRSDMPPPDDGGEAA